VPVRVPTRKLPKGLKAGYHARRDLASCGLPKVVRKQTEHEPAQFSMKSSVVFEEHTQALRYCPDKLPVWQSEQEILT